MKRKAIDVAIGMGFVARPFVKYGNKALVGQFVRPYSRDDGTYGRRDFSAIINARR